MKKFTLLPNDEIKFKIKEGGTFATNEIMADLTYYYKIARRTYS